MTIISISFISGSDCVLYLPNCANRMNGPLCVLLANAYEVNVLNQWCVEHIGSQASLCCDLLLRLLHPQYNYNHV